MQLLTSIRRGFVWLWTVDRPLTAAALLMAAVVPLFLLGMAIDPRLITGVPAWLKPAKFAVSTTIYMFTLVWLFSHLPAWPRVRRFVSWTTAVVLVGEVAIIALQAWRGTTSHFNFGTPLDAALFSTMGAAIVLQTAASVSVAVALWRQSFADAALGWALRLGMTLTIIGASAGGLMTRPTSAQLADGAATHRLSVMGAHTVGAPDGGPGLPGTGWSLQHGDLRVPHFVGLHAIQALGAWAWLLGLFGVSAARRVRLVVLGSASYIALFVLLLWQALLGRPLFSADAATVSALALWALATGAAFAWSFRPRHRSDADATLNWINP
jgi:hypothetical protein